MEEQAERVIQEVEHLGGMTEAIISGWWGVLLGLACMSRLGLCVHLLLARGAAPGGHDGGRHLRWGRVQLRLACACSSHKQKVEHAGLQLVVL